MPELKGFRPSEIIRPSTPEPRNAFAAGLSSGVDDLQGLGYSALGAVADTAGATGVRDWANQRADLQDYESRINGRPDLEQVENIADQPGKWLPYAGYQVAKQIPTLAGAVGTGLLVPEVAVPAWLARGAAALPRAMGGGGLAARAGIDEVAAAIKAGQTFGKQVVGGGAFNYGTGVGSLYQEAVAGGDPNAGVQSLLGAVPYALAETLPEAMLVGRIGHGSGFTGGLGSRVGKAALTQGATGATSEILQNEMEMAYNGQVTPEQAASRRLNSAVAGGLVEGLLGGLGGVRRAHGVPNVGMQQDLLQNQDWTTSQGFEQPQTQQPQTSPLGDLTPDWTTAPGAGGPAMQNVIDATGLYPAVGEQPAAFGSARRGPAPMSGMPGVNMDPLVADVGGAVATNPADTDALYGEVNGDPGLAEARRRYIEGQQKQQTLKTMQADQQAENTRLAQVKTEMEGFGLKGTAYLQVFDRLKTAWDEKQITDEEFRDQVNELALRKKGNVEKWLDVKLAPAKAAQGATNVGVPSGTGPGPATSGGVGSVVEPGSVAAPGPVSAPGVGVPGTAGVVGGSSTQAPVQSGGTTRPPAPISEDVEEARQGWNDEIAAKEAAGYRGLATFDELHPDAQQLLIDAPSLGKKVMEAAAKLNAEKQAEARAAEREEAMAKTEINLPATLKKIASYGSAKMQAGLRFMLGSDEYGNLVDNPLDVTEAARRAGYRSHSALSKEADALGITDVGVNRLHRTMSGGVELHQEVADETARAAKEEGKGDINANVDASKTQDLASQPWYPKNMAEATTKQIAEAAVRAVVYDTPANRAAQAALYKEAQKRATADQKGFVAAYYAAENAAKAKKGNRNEGEIAVTPTESSAESELSEDRGVDEAERADAVRGEPADSGDAKTATAPKVTIRKKRTIQKSETLSMAMNTVAEVREELESLKIGLDSKKLHIVQDIEDLPDDLRGALEASMPTGGRVQGFVSDGNAYLIAGNIKPGSARAVFMHEVGSHMGLQRLMGAEDFNRLTNKIVEWADADDGSLESTVAKKAIARVGNARTRDSQIKTEMLAYFIEESVKAGVDPTATKYSSEISRFMKEVFNAIKRGLKKLGFDNAEGLTAQDVVDMAYGAAHIALEDTETRGANEAVAASRALLTEFSIASDTQANNANTLYRNVSERVRARMPEKSKDSWSTVKDFLEKKAPWFLTNAQLAEQYGKPLQSLKKYVGLQQTMTMDKNTQAMAVHDVAVDWDQLAKPVKDSLNSVMQQATLLGVHPDVAFNDKANESLKPEDRAAYDKLSKQYNALPANAKKIYQEAKKVLEVQWDERRKAYASLVTYTYAKRVEAADARGDTDAVVQLLQEADQAVADYDRQVAQLRQGPYFPLVRFGNYLVIGESKELKAEKAKLDDATGEDRRKIQAEVDKLKRDSKHYNVSAHETKGQANSAARELEGTGLDVRQDLTDQHIDGMRAVSQVTLDNITQVIDSQFDKSTAGKLNEAVSEVFLRSLPEMHALHREAARKGIAGASPDMLRAFASVGQSSAFYTSRLKYASELADTLFKMKAEARGDTKLQHIYREMEQRMALDMKRTETPVQDAASSLSWVYHLGISPSFMFINSTQPWLVTGPMLAGKFGLVKATRALGSASRDALAILKAARYKDGKFDPWSGINEESLGSKEERTAIRELMNKGIVDEGAQHELPMFSDDSSRNLAKFNRYMGWTTQQIELLNRLSSALSSFRLARGEGMDYDAAVKYAYDTTLNTQFDYSQEGTARFMREGGGVPLAKLVFQFRRYQQGMLYLFGSNIKKSFGTGQEAKEARASLKYFAMSAGMSSGVLGLPFMGSALALAQLGADDDDPRGDMETRLRNLLFDITGDRDAATVLAKGIPAAFGADLSKRIGLGDLAAVFPMARFQGRTGKEQAGELALSALGPAGGLAAQFYDGMTNMGEGNWGKGLEKLAPKFIADASKAMRYAGPGLTDAKGAPTGVDLNAWDVALKALGVTSTEEANYYEGTRAIKDTEAAYKSREGRVGQVFKAGLRDGDMAAAREAVNKFNEDHPENPITSKDEQRWRKEQRGELKDRSSSGVKLGTKQYKSFNDAGRFAQ